MRRERRRGLIKGFRLRGVEEGFWGDHKEEKRRGWCGCGCGRGGRRRRAWVLGWVLHLEYMLFTACRLGTDKTDFSCERAYYWRWWWWWGQFDVRISKMKMDMVAVSMIKYLHARPDGGMGRDSTT